MDYVITYKMVSYIYYDVQHRNTNSSVTLPVAYHVLLNKLIVSLLLLKSIHEWRKGYYGQRLSGCGMSSSAPCIDC